MSRSGISERLAKFVRERAGHCCEYCLLPQEWQESTFHIDHILPRVAKGSASPNNLALACVGCSLTKSAKTEASDPQTQQVVRLFHPRLDKWHEHFAWNDRWLIRGKTPIGRATILALQLNRRRLVNIRRELAKHGRYPSRQSPAGDTE